MPTSVTNGWQNKVTPVEHLSCTHLEVKCFPSHLCAHAILHGSVRQGAQHAGLVVSRFLSLKKLCTYGQCFQNWKENCQLMFSMPIPAIVPDSVGTVCSAGIQM